MRALGFARARRNAGTRAFSVLSHPIGGFPRLKPSPKNPDRQKIPIEFGVSCCWVWFSRRTDLDLAVCPAARPCERSNPTPTSPHRAGSCFLSACILIEDPTSTSLWICPGTRARARARARARRVPSVSNEIWARAPPRARRQGNGGKGPRSRLVRRARAAAAAAC